jgi:DNA-directed RNA polymerase III subunit RPC2
MRRRIDASRSVKLTFLSFNQTGCKSSKHVVKLMIPYACKLLFQVRLSRLSLLAIRLLTLAVSTALRLLQELMAMNIAPRLVLEDAV